MESKADYEVVKLTELTDLIDWQSRLEERQRREIAFARLYARDFNHGTAGHNRLLLIAGLAGMLDAMAALAQGEPIPQRTLGYILNVPYHSQHEDDARRYRRDCGPACIEMVGKFYRPSVAVSTDDIMTHITGGADRSTYINELQDAARLLFGIILLRHDGATWADLLHWIMDEGKPVVVLGHYGSLQTRMDRGWTGGHYVIVTGIDAIRYQEQVVERAIVHDPDFYNGLHGQGAFIPLVKDHFMSFWDASKDRGNPKYMALVPEI